MAYNEIAERKALNALNDDAHEPVVTILMNTYGDDIFRFCGSMLHSDDDAQDVLQTVFIQAYQGLAGFNQQSTFRTWLYSIARNRCLDHIKSKNRLHKRVEFVDEVPEFDATDNHNLDNQDPFATEILNKCLGQLSNSVRAAVLLRFQAGHSYEEAAKILSEKAGTLQARVTRSLPTLRRCVESHGVAL